MLGKQGIIKMYSTAAAAATRIAGKIQGLVVIAAVRVALAQLCPSHGIQGAVVTA